MQNLLGPIVFRIMALFRLQVLATNIMLWKLDLALRANTMLVALALEWITCRMLVDRVISPRLKFRRMWQETV